MMHWIRAWVYLAVRVWLLKMLKFSLAVLLALSLYLRSIPVYVPVNTRMCFTRMCLDGSLWPCYSLTTLFVCLQALPVCLPVCVDWVYDPFSVNPHLAIHKLYLCLAVCLPLSICVCRWAFLTHSMASVVWLFTSCTCVFTCVYLYV